MLVASRSRNGIELSSEVMLRSRDGWRGSVVAGPRVIGGAIHYEVRWRVGGQGRRWVPAGDLAAVDHPQLRVVDGDSFRADLALAKFFRDFVDVLFSMGASRTEFLVYQFKPVLQFIQQQSHGLLIADEVGLGKTIEAALILRELMARGAVNRVLVVCPANLREKWSEELRNRFSIELQDLRSADYRALRREFDRAGTWPTFYGITSLEGLRRRDVKEVIQETGIHFDLVIVDEAHHLRNPSTRSFDVGEILSDQSDHILLLSATPIQTGQSDLLSLLRLIEPAEFNAETLDELDVRLEPNRYLNAALAVLAQPEADLERVAAAMSGVLATPHGAGFRDDQVFTSWLRQLEDRSELATEEVVRLRRDLQARHTLAPYYTRTRKRDVEEAARRRARTIEVQLTEEERDFYEAWVRFIVALHRYKTPRVPPGFATVSRERQAASCLPAARERVEGLIAEVDIETEVESSDPDPRTPQRPTLSRFTRLLEGRPRIAYQLAKASLREAAERLPAHDSKLDQLIELIGQLLAEKPGRKMLVFTFFKTTLRYLERALVDAGVSVLSISGDDPPDRRPQIVGEFKRDPTCNVLLSTEVGSEGLDFQFCDVVINYDLPWNPMRVEQRIGRIDRFGQKEEEVIVASFFVDETIDTRVLRRLYERIRVFEEAIGAVEPILGPVIQELQRDVFAGELSTAEQQRHAYDAATRVENLRQETERFEEQRVSLLGQGDLLLGDIQDIRRSGRFISPAEVRALILRWLEREDPDGKGLTKPGLDGVEQLHISGTALNRASAWFDERRISANTDRLMGQARVSGFCPVTFERDALEEREWLAFLHSGHPIVQYASNLLLREEPPDWIERLGCFALPEQLIEDTGSVPIALAIYSLDEVTLNHRESMLPVALAVESLDERAECADLLLGSIHEAVERPRPDWLDEELARTLEMAAHEYAEQRREREETSAVRHDAARRVVERTQLRRSYSARIARKTEIGQRVDNANIKRLYEGEVRNLQSELDDRLTRLDDAPAPVIQLELLSLAVFV